MNFFSGTIWITLGGLALYFGWKLWKDRKELKQRFQWYVVQLTAKQMAKQLEKQQKK